MRFKCGEAIISLYKTSTDCYRYICYANDNTIFRGEQTVKPYYEPVDVANIVFSFVMNDNMDLLDSNEDGLIITEI